jgi:hypothetical protein
MSEAVVCFFGDQPIAFLFVDVVGGIQFTVGPQHDFAIALPNIFLKIPIAAASDQTG